MLTVKRTGLAIWATTLLLLSVTGTATARGGNVSPPVPFGPSGWTIDSMARSLALFSTSGNNPTYYPSTPFQVLHADPSQGQSTPTNGGIVATGGNSFSVGPHTRYFIPLFYVDDSPAVLGTFPSTRRGAISYFFGPSQYGGRDFMITVDGRRFHIGPAYLSGPVTAPSPLLDGGGTHIIMLGAFMNRLSPGTHTVTITGGVFGAGLQPTDGIAFLAEDLTYEVNVS